MRHNAGILLLYIMAAASSAMNPEMQSPVAVGFDNLPVELCRKTWDLALPEPQVIEFQLRFWQDIVYWYSKPLPTDRATHTPVQNIPLVCKEAYETFKNEYQVIKLSGGEQGLYRTVTFNPSTDIIYLSDSEQGRFFGDFVMSFPEVSKTMRKMAVVNWPLPWHLSMRHLVEGLKYFSALEVFYILVSEYEQSPNPDVKGAVWRDRDSQSWRPGVKDEKVWKIPEDVQNLIEEVREEKWPQWKVPVVKVMTWEALELEMKK